MVIIRRRTALAFLLILPILTAAVLSWNRSLTGDEGLTVFVTGESHSVLIDNVSLDNHPPLYYLLMRGWRNLFGGSLVSLRAFAMLPAAVMIVISAFSLSPLVALLMAFSPFLLHLSVELRMYGFLALAGLLQLLAVRYELRERSRLSLVLLILCLSAGTWIHHFGWLGVAAGLTVMAFRKRWARAVITAAVVIMLYLPWAPRALEQWSSFGGEALDTGTVYLQSPSLQQRLTGVPFSIGGTLIRFSAGTAGTKFGLTSPETLDLMLLLALLLTTVMAVIAWRGVSRDRFPAATILLWVIIPLSLLRPSSRHFALAFPAFLLLAGAGIRGLGRKLRTPVLFLCLGLMILFQICFVLEPVMPQRCTFRRDLREAALVAGGLAVREDCPIMAHLDHYTSMALMIHLRNEGYGHLEVRTPFDRRFERGRYFVTDPREVLGYLQRNTDSLVGSWLEASPVFVLIANDPGRAGGRVFGSENRFIGMGSDVMSDLDLMEVLREKASLERFPLENSEGPFSLLLVRGQREEN